MKISQYFSESYQELKKVAWPKQKDVVVSITVVLVSTLVMAVVLGVVDFVLLKGAFSLFSR